MLKNYKRNEYGGVSQIDADALYTYDEEYVRSRYDIIPDMVHAMSYLRLGYIFGAIDRLPTSILDVGYGNGDFLKTCISAGIKAYGNDLFDDYLPEGAEFVKDITHPAVDVVTFFDSLEHFPSIECVKHLRCNYVVISMPWCHHVHRPQHLCHSDEWFENWKHRRPGEHLHHFDKQSLINFMGHMGFCQVVGGYVEDVIRKPISAENTPNILTGVFQRRVYYA